MKELEYPFDSSFLLQKRRKLKKALLADGSARMEKRIAVLGGSTTNDIVSMLELFLLNCGIQPERKSVQKNSAFLCRCCDSTSC